MTDRLPHRQNRPAGEFFTGPVQQEPPERLSDFAANLERARTEWKPRHDPWRRVRVQIHIALFFAILFFIASTVRVGVDLWRLYGG